MNKTVTALVLAPVFGAVAFAITWIACPAVLDYMEKRDLEKQEAKTIKLYPVED